LLPAFVEIQREVDRGDVTLQLRHFEYLEQRWDGYGYTQFCQYQKRLINDNYFCRRVLPQLRMLPHASGKNRTIMVSLGGTSIKVREHEPSGRICPPLLHSSLERSEV
jgi:hypothetical protein